MIVHGPFPVGEPRVMRQALAARRAGYKVDVVAMRRPGEPARELVDGLSVERLRIEHRRGSGAGRMLTEYAGFTVLAALRVARRSISRRYSAVQVHNPPDFLIAAAIVPKLLGARVVFDVHDLAPDMFHERFRGRRGAALADALLRRVERIATALADSVITVHEPYRRELTARGVEPAKTTVVMNTVDEELLPPPAPKDGDADEPFRIVYHGTVNAWYGLALVVEALATIAATVPSATLAVYGEGDALESVGRRAAELGVSERIALSGRYLEHREVLTLAASASVGVIPNLPTRLNRFALSSKLFEYVALGVPVVCADLPTFRDHFDPGEVRFFEAGNAAALAEALLDVASHPGDADRRAAAARRRYDASYRWPVNAERYLAALSGNHAPVAAGPGS